MNTAAEQETTQGMRRTPGRGGPSAHERTFIDSLVKLVEADNRAALAALRRGLGTEPGTAAEMYPYVARFITRGMEGWTEGAYYLVAALFAVHQESWHASDDETGPRNLGASLARLARQVESGSIEKRFVALLNSHRDDLPEHLRHAVALLKTHDVPIDWPQLLHDLQGWYSPMRVVQRAWAGAYWRAVAASDAAKEATADAQNTEPGDD